MKRNETLICLAYYMNSRKRKNHEKYDKIIILRVQSFKWYNLVKHYLFFLTKQVQQVKNLCMEVPGKSVLILYNGDWEAGATSIVVFIAVSNFLLVYSAVEIHSNWLFNFCNFEHF